MFRILAIAATLFGLTAAAQADVWRFVDAQGHVAELIFHRSGSDLRVKRLE